MQTNQANSRVAKIPAVAYARVSTLLGQDPENQLVGIREFAIARNFDLKKEHIDFISGAKEKRPGLDQLIIDARNGKYKVIIIWGIDRLGRSTKHLLNLLEELKHYGVSLISLRENLDFTTPYGQLALTMLSAVGQLEKELISERIKTALAVKKQTAIKNGTDWKCGRPTKINSSLEKTVLDLRRQGISIRKIEETVGNKISRSTINRIIKKLSQNPIKNEGCN